MKFKDPKALLECSLERNFGICRVSPFKANFFHMLYRLLPRTLMSRSFAYVLILGSFAQLLGTTILVLEAKDPVLRSAKYFRVFPFVEYTESQLIYFIALYGVSLCLIVYALLAAMAALLPGGLSEHYASFCLPAFYWLGITPVTELYLSFFNCDSETGNHYIATGVKCWGVFYTIQSVIIILMLILWCAVLLTITFVSTHSHPYNKNPLSHFPWNFEVVYAVIRIAFAVACFVFDEDSVFDEYFQWALCYLSSIYFVSLLIHVFPYYDCTVCWLFTGCALTFAICTLWRSFFAITKSSLTFGKSTDVIFLVVTMAVCLPLAKLLRSRRLRKLMSRIKVKTPEELDMQVYTFLMGFVLKESATEVADSFLNGYLDTFKQSCRDDSCPLFAMEPFEIDRVFCDSSCEEKKRSIGNGTLRNFARYLLDNKSTKEIFNASLSLQLARIYAYVLGNLHLACVKILDTEDMEPGIFIQFALFCFKQDIINYFNSIEASNEKKGRGSFYKVLIHEKLLDEFIELLKNSTRIRSRFYNELRNIPNLNTLHKLGFKVMKLSMDINTVWKQLKAIYPFHRYALKVYSDYLCMVTGEIEEAALIKQLLDKMLWEQDTAKELSKHQVFSENATSIIMGGERHNTGKVLMASSSVERLFGYAPKTLVNRSVMILMPEILRRRHSEILQKHFASSKDRVGDRPFQSFGLRRDGYIFPVKITKQQVYSLKLGILYVGNICSDVFSENFNFILTDVDGKIAGVTRRIGEALQISPNMVAEQQINIRDYSIGLEEDLATIEGSYKLFFAASKEKVHALLTRKSSIRHGLDSIMKDALTIDSKGSDFRGYMKCQISTLSYPQIDFSMKLFQFPSIRTDIEAKILGNDSKRATAIASEISPSKRASKLINPESITEEKEQEPETKGDEGAGRAKESEMDFTAMTHNVSNDPLRNRTSVPKLQRINTNLMNTKSMAYAKSLKKNAKFNALMNQPYSAFYPASIRQLTWLLYSCLLSMLILVVSRFVLDRVLSVHFSSFGRVTLLNMRGFHLMGDIAKTIELLIVYGEIPDVIDVGARDGYFDYGLLLGEESREGVRSYKDYTMVQMKEACKSLHSDKIALTKKLKKFDKDYAEKVNAMTLASSYNSSVGGEFSYTNSIKYSIVGIMAHAFKIIETIENGGAAEFGGLSEYFILNSTYKVTVNYVENFFNEMTGVYKDIQTRDNRFRLAFLITFAVIATALIVVSFIYLTLLNKELSTLLLMFTRISKTLLKEQICTHTAFIRAVSAKGMEDLEDEALNVRDVDEEEEPVSDKNAGVPQQAKNEGKAKRKTKMREYIPQRNNRFQISLVVALICAAVFAAYFGCDYKAKQFSSVLLEKVHEIYHLKSNVYFNSYTVAYIYNYILSYKKGICGEINCLSSLVELSYAHSANINELLSLHKSRESANTQKFEDFAENVMERNPCETVEHFKGVEQCASLMGGIFKHGSHAASNTFIELAAALYIDFTFTELSQEVLAQYLNDKRLLDLEILGTLLLSPAYSLLSMELEADVVHSSKSHRNLGILLLTLFVALLLVLAVLVRVVLLEYLRRLIYDVKILLSNLPSKLIVSTGEIFRYFIDSSAGKSAS